MENIKKEFREINSFHLTSFLAWTFLNFLAHCGEIERGLKMFSIHEKLNRNKSLQCDTYKSFSVIVISAKSCLVMDRRVPENRVLEVSRRNGFLKGKWRNFEKSSNIP